MNRLKNLVTKERLCGVLGILAAVGLGSLVETPRHDQGWKTIPVPRDENKLTTAVYFYRCNGSLPSQTFYCGFTSEEEIKADKAFDAVVITEAKRQEAQEASWHRLP